MAVVFPGLLFSKGLPRLTKNQTHEGRGGYPQRSKCQYGNTDRSRVDGRRDETDEHIDKKHCTRGQRKAHQKFDGSIKHLDSPRGQAFRTKRDEHR